MSHTQDRIRSIGVLGVGRVGTALARQAMSAGYTVSVAGSGHPEDIAMIVEFTTPGAAAKTAFDVVKSADLVVLAVPLHRYRSLPMEALAHKIAIDVMNYWEPVDGRIPEFEDPTTTSSEVVQSLLASTRLVKTLNHIGYHELETDGTPTGTPNRRALALASDDEEAKALVADVIDRWGYDVVDAGPLSAGVAFQPGTPIFEGRHNAAQMAEQLDLTLTPTAHR